MPSPLVIRPRGPLVLTPFPPVRPRAQPLIVPLDQSEAEPAARSLIYAPFPPVRPRVQPLIVPLDQPDTDAAARFLIYAPLPSGGGPPPPAFNLLIVIKESLLVPGMIREKIALPATGGAVGSPSLTKETFFG